MPKGSDNPFPSVLVVEGTAPASPASGDQRLYIDSTGHQVKRVNSSGTVVTLTDSANEATAPDFKPSGLTGATAASRYVGATTSGAPVSGTFVTGDWITDQAGKRWTCTAGGSPGTWAQEPGTGGGGGGLYSAYLCYQDQEASGTAGGTFTSGSWVTRVLNTEVADTGNHGTLASNQITLDAGTYRVQIGAPCLAVDRTQVRLRNITDSATLVTGQSSWAYSANNEFCLASCVGRFTIATSKVLEVQHQAQTTSGTNGLGVAGSFGAEIYTTIELWKE